MKILNVEDSNKHYDSTICNMKICVTTANYKYLKGYAFPINKKIKRVFLLTVLNHSRKSIENFKLM